MRVRRPTKSEVLLTVAAAVTSLGLAELAVTALMPQPTWRTVRTHTPAMFLPSDTFPYRLRPGYSGRFKRPEFEVHVRIDSSGFRSGRSHVASGGPLILSLGDSFTFGWGVNDDEAYPVRLGDRLQLRPGHARARTINAGFASGYAPDTYLLFSRLYAPVLKPDLVTVGVFVGNDIDGYSENRWVRQDSNGMPLAIVNTESRVDEQGFFVPRETPLGYRVPILRNSHLLHLAGATFRTFTRRAQRDAVPPLYRLTYSAHTSQALERSAHLLLAVDSVVAAAGAKCVFILIPTREQVLAPTLAPTTDRDYGRPQRELTRLLEEGGASVFDLLPSMRGSTDRERFYFAEDQHWTPAGHDFAATVFAGWLTERHGDTSPRVR